MLTHPIVSADDHMDMAHLPPALWQERLPLALRPRGPRVQRFAEGDFWVADGDRLGPSGRTLFRVHSNAIVRAGMEDDGFRASDPLLRLADMDRDGVYAQVIYGPVSGIRVKDPDLKAACLRVYNDWALEFNAASPDRLCVLACLPVHDPRAGVEELQRASRGGHRGAVVSIFESAVPISEPVWEPLWSVAAETGMPISFHLAGGFHTLKSAAGSWRTAATAAVSPIQLDEALAVMVMSGALDRHPGLRLVLGESGLGWIPYVLERLDLEYEHYRPIAKDLKLSAEPSRIFARQVYATFQEDRFGVSVMGRVGANNIMWASDYPHVDSTFPHSRRAIEEQFAGVDAATVRTVTGGTAARLYQIRGPALPQA